MTSATGNGRWQYATGDGSWTAFGPVSPSAALLLGAGTQLRYLPDAANGETATLHFVAWDQTAGTASTPGTPRHAATGGGGGSSAWSSQVARAMIAVSSVADAPVLDGTRSPTLADQVEDYGAPVGAVGTAVSTLVDFATPTGGYDNIVDVDADGLGAFALPVAARRQRDRGATGSTLLLGDADVGRAISVRVTVLDGQRHRGVADAARRPRRSPTSTMCRPACRRSPAARSRTRRSASTPRHRRRRRPRRLQLPVAARRRRDQPARPDRRCCSATPTSARAISVRVNWTDGSGTAESLTSAPTAPVANVNDAPTGAAGDRRQRDRGPDAERRHQRHRRRRRPRRASATSGCATASRSPARPASTLLLGDADVGSAISVRVGWTDGQGTAESLTSARDRRRRQRQRRADRAAGDRRQRGRGPDADRVDHRGIADADGLGSLQLPVAARRRRDRRRRPADAACSATPTSAARSACGVDWIDGHGTAEIADERGDRGGRQRQRRADRRADDHRQRDRGPDAGRRHQRRSPTPTASAPSATSGCATASRSPARPASTLLLGDADVGTRISVRVELDRRPRHRRIADQRGDRTGRQRQRRADRRCRRSPAARSRTRR